MLTAKQAREISDKSIGSSFNIRHILEKVKEVAESGKTSYSNLEFDDISEAEYSYLKDLGYNIIWDNVLLRYEISW